MTPPHAAEEIKFAPGTLLQTCKKYSNHLKMIIFGSFQNEIQFHHKLNVYMSVFVLKLVCRVNSTHQNSMEIMFSTSTSTFFTPLQARPTLCHVMTL